jgi:hypothetical protein
MNTYNTYNTYIKHKLVYIVMVVILLAMVFSFDTVSAFSFRLKTKVKASAITLLAGMYNGTGQGFTGGSQANGGVDDWNNGSAPPTNAYKGTWTQCSAGNSYCGTGDSGADAKDNSTGLIWSKPCNGVGCTSFSDSSALTYSWDSSHGNNNSLTSSQLCSTHSGWSLPHQKQLMQAYIDGSYNNLESTGVSRHYWSATTLSWGTTHAWSVVLSHGYTNLNTKTYTPYVRCVREF